MSKFLKKILLLTLVLIINNCSNTRVVVESVKKVIKNDKKGGIEEKIETNFTKGHYKVGQPYIINNIKYIPKLVSSMIKMELHHGMDQNLIKN